MAGYTKIRNHCEQENVTTLQPTFTKAIFFPEKHDGKLVIVSVIDNLLKGAAGQAVQNMNLMFGLDEKCGLRLKPQGF